METGTVIGSVWATKKADKIVGQKLLVVEMKKGKKQEQKERLVAADVIGAGIGDTVLVCRGHAARLAIGEEDAPVDAAVAGIIDSLDIPNEK